MINTSLSQKKKKKKKKNFFPKSLLKRLVVQCALQNIHLRFLFFILVNLETKSQFNTVAAI